MLPPQTAKAQLCLVWWMKGGTSCHCAALRVTTAKLLSSSCVKPCEQAVWALPSQIILRIPAELEATGRGLSMQPSRVLRQGFCREGSRFSMAAAVCSDQLLSSNIPSVFQILILGLPLCCSTSLKGTYREQCQVCGIRDNLLMALSIVAALFGKLSMAYADFVHYFKCTYIIILLPSR